MFYRNHIAFASDRRRAKPKFSINFISGRKHDERTIAGAAGGIQNIERAGKIHFKVMPGIGYRSGNCDLRGTMIDFIRMGHGFLHLPGIANIAYRDLKPAGISCCLSQPFHVVVHSGAGEIIKNVHLRLGAGKQRMGQVRPDKACSSKNQHRARILRTHSSPLYQTHCD